LLTARGYQKRNLRHRNEPLGLCWPLRKMVHQVFADGKELPEAKLEAPERTAGPLLASAKDGAPSFCGRRRASGVWEATRRKDPEHRNEPLGLRASAKDGASSFLRRRRISGAMREAKLGGPNQRQGWGHRNEPLGLWPLRKIVTRTLADEGLPQVLGGPRQGLGHRNEPLGLRASAKDGAPDPR